MGQLGDLSPQGRVAVGVIVGLISASLQAIGLTLQRKSHILEDVKYPYDLHRPPYKRRRWQMGMLMFVISNIVGSTIQITTLPLPVLSTLQASGLVFNTIFATLILGEPFTKYSVIGTGLVAIGAVLIALFGAIGEPAHTLDQLLVLLERRTFIVWMICTGALVALVLVGCRFLRLLLPSSRSKRLSIISAPSHLQIFHGRIKLLRGMCYGFVSGILSAHSLLLAKSAVELLVRTIVDRVNQFNRWQSWVILIAMISLALTQLFYLHRGLKLCSTSVLYPFVFCIYNIIAILDGLIYFRQVSQLGRLHAGLIALGTIVLLCGVLCLSWRLEDVNTFAGPSVPKPALGPGMGMVEDHVHDARDVGLGGEENGERQPLLQGSHARTGSIHQRAPSLPLFSPLPDSTTDIEPASIWAELDDEADYASANSNPLAYHTFNTRPRSKSGTYGVNGVFKRPNDGTMPLPRRMRHTSSPITHRTWDLRRILSPTLEGRSRRTSTPAVESHQPKRRSWSPLLYNGVTTPLIQGDRNEHSDHDSRHQSQSTLAGPRNLLSNAWRTTLSYLSRITHRPARSPIDPERSPDDTHPEQP